LIFIEHKVLIFIENKAMGIMGQTLA